MAVCMQVQAARVRCIMDLPIHEIHFNVNTVWGRGDVTKMAGGTLRGG